MNKNTKNGVIAGIVIILLVSVIGVSASVAMLHLETGTGSIFIVIENISSGGFFPFDYDVIGPNGWHQSGKNHNLPSSIFPESGFVRFDNVPFGTYTCKCTYPITGETQTKTITIDELEPHEGPYPHGFCFTFGKYIHPVQLNSTTWEWGYIPPYTEETHYARTFSADGTLSTKLINEHSTFPVNTFLVVRNLTFWWGQEKFEQAQMIDYTTTNCTKEWIESHITQMFIDGVRSFCTSRIGPESVGHLYYVKAHYAGIQYVDGYNLNGGYHANKNYPFEGLAYTIVLDELVFRTGYFGWYGFTSYESGGTEVHTGSNAPALLIVNFINENMFEGKIALSTWDPDYNNFPATWMHIANFGPLPEFDAGYITGGYGITGEAQHFTVLAGVPTADIVTDFWTNQALLPPDFGFGVYIPPIIPPIDIITKNPSIPILLIVAIIVIVTVIAVIRHSRKSKKSR